MVKIISQSIDGIKVGDRFTHSPWSSVNSFTVFKIVAPQTIIVTKDDCANWKNDFATAITNYAGTQYTLTGRKLKSGDIEWIEKGEKRNFGTPFIKTKNPYCKKSISLI